MTISRRINDALFKSWASFPTGWFCREAIEFSEGIQFPLWLPVVSTGEIAHNLDDLCEAERDPSQQCLRVFWPYGFWWICSHGAIAKTLIYWKYWSCRDPPSDSYHPAGQSDDRESQSSWSSDPTSSLFEADRSHFSIKFAFGSDELCFHIPEANPFALHSISMAFAWAICLIWAAVIGAVFLSICLSPLLKDFPKGRLMNRLTIFLRFLIFLPQMPVSIPKFTLAGSLWIERESMLYQQALETTRLELRTIFLRKWAMMN